MIAVVNLRGPFSPFVLGQAPAPAVPPIAAVEPIEIDKELAQTTLDAVALIEEAAKEDRGVQLEPCWRVLRIAKWGRIGPLRNKLVAFVRSSGDVLIISELEFQLMDEILACSVELSEGEGASLKRTLEVASIVVGIAGGIALIVSRFV